MIKDFERLNALIVFDDVFELNERLVIYELLGLLFPDHIFLFNWGGLDLAFVGRN